ncbi:RING finger protein 215 isoform X2 [Protopterus annectens]|uniref:RING finger protein 215 isoform X2 n=1 Tax=Protopterus annectens TaxID=7888 RepID=UPI001CFA2D5A|nr:RING finger protein 215 isoform X2 [Protopterus annectens]
MEAADSFFCGHYGDIKTCLIQSECRCIYYINNALFCHPQDGNIASYDSEKVYISSILVIGGSDRTTKTASPVIMILLLNDDIPMKTEDDEAWIGVLPVEKEQGERMKSDSQESFTSAIVNKMKRALVLGASALLILALNQNTVHEMDVSQVLTRPIIVIQTSENVTKLISVLLRGLRASARITRKALAQDNLGVTLTLWSTCGLSRGGLYGEWQGVICTGENSSQVQKYLQKLWNTILLVALSLCTGVIVQAHWQFMRNQSNNEDAEFTLKQDLLKQLSSLKTKKYHPHKKQRVHQSETENCAVCLDQFHRNQCLRVLPCLHEFHRDCVDPWLLLQQTCPLCKRSILGNLCGDS